MLSLRGCRLLPLRSLHEFDGDGTTELGVPAFVDDPHAAATDDTDQSVAVSLAKARDRLLGAPD